MKLDTLLSTLKHNMVLPPEWRDRDVQDIAQDSRKVMPGSLFVAVRGFHSDGHQFIPQAVQRGAAAIVAEEPASSAVSADMPYIIVEDTRQALALMADEFFGRPSQRLRLVGITGTNGKTTTTYLVKAVIEASGSTAGLIGTIDYRIGNRVYPAPNTTPGSLELQRLLAEMADSGADSCVMEVSSHALAQSRTLGCKFAVAAFTNLTQDHLDFHETMDAYFQAKLFLFTSLAQDAWAVINSDDAHAGDIIKAIRARVVTTGFSKHADVRPEGPIGHDLHGLSFDVATPEGVVTVESPLVGRHNISNILTAIGIGCAMGFENKAIARGIKNMKAVPGRMEKVDEGQKFGVIVDYAHTEDALLRLLEAVRDVTQGRIITVFGCGGDRDWTKRPRMGAAAINGSDEVIVTSDNPRTEDPASIIREIESGMSAGVRTQKGEPRKKSSGTTTASKIKHYHIIPDRAEAVAAAIEMAMPGDVVVLAGKGHEDYQVIGDTKIPFDDREHARAALRTRPLHKVGG